MKSENVSFTIKCEMRARWVPHFLGMLKHMQSLGSMGSSRFVGFYSDGDGDFRPKFTVDAGLSDESIAKPSGIRRDGTVYYDAG